MKYDTDIQMSQAILAGDAAAWDSTICAVSKALNSWRNSTCVDVEDVINFSIFKAAKTYKPKRKFINHAIHIAHNSLCKQYKWVKIRTDIMGTSTETIQDVSDESSLLDAMIAKDTAKNITTGKDDVSRFAWLVLKGCSRVQATKAMGFSGFKAFTVVRKLKKKIQGEN
jgi:hypothetical protein